VRDIRPFHAVNAVVHFPGARAELSAVRAAQKSNIENVLRCIFPDPNRLLSAKALKMGWRIVIAFRTE